MRTKLCRNASMMAIALSVLSACKPQSVAETAGAMNSTTNGSIAHAQRLDIVAVAASTQQPSQSMEHMKGYRSIIITSNMFLDNLCMESFLTLKKVRLYVLPELFSSTNAYRLDELFERLATGDAKYGLNVTGRLFRTAASALRYRALLPYLQDVLLSDGMSNNLDRAALCINLLCSIPHADTLRAWWEIETKLPANSALRAGTIPLWSSNMPLFRRNDCLEMYLDIVNHPERQTYAVWHGTAEYLSFFTNDTAVAGLQSALKVVKDPGKYWSGMTPSMDIVAVESLLKHQQEYVQGKRGPINMDGDKPFDE